jgi:hypothetical protein
MKATQPVKRRKAGKATRGKAVSRKKKTFDLFWLTDRPLPPAEELPENCVLVMRRDSSC